VATSVRSAVAPCASSHPASDASATSIVGTVDIGRRDRRERGAERRELRLQDRPHERGEYVDHAALGDRHEPDGELDDLLQREIEATVVLLGAGRLEVEHRDELGCVHVCLLVHDAGGLLGGAA
jgi:hypothetical protein